MARNMRMYMTRNVRIYLTTNVQPRLRSCGRVFLMSHFARYHDFPHFLGAPDFFECHVFLGFHDFLAYKRGHSFLSKLKRVSFDPSSVDGVQDGSLSTALSSNGSGESPDSACAPTACPDGAVAPPRDVYMHPPLASGGAGADVQPLTSLLGALCVALFLHHMGTRFIWFLILELCVFVFRVPNMTGYQLLWICFLTNFLIFSRLSF